MQENTGGQKSFAFLKSPINYIKYLLDINELFTKKVLNNLLKNCSENFQKGLTANETYLDN